MGPIIMFRVVTVSLLSILVFASFDPPPPTPKTAKLNSTNEIRKGDIVALILALAGIVVFTVCLIVALVKRFRNNESSTSIYSTVVELDDDSIIKKDVSGKSDLQNSDSVLKYETFIGSFCAFLVTLCLLYYMLNFEDD